MDLFLLYCLSVIEDATHQTKFEAIYTAYRHAMLYAALKVLKDHSLAEDAVHEAFLRILDQLHKIDETDCHKTRKFLVVIVEHVAYDMYNKRKRRSESFLYEETEEVRTDDAAGEIQHIVRFIKQLPVTYSHLMVLRFVEGLSDQECAQVLNISEPAVRKRLERGRKLLKERLEEEAKEHANI